MRTFKKEVPKIVTVVGARPQFVKAAVISRTIKSTETPTLSEVIVHTGQHYDQNMSEVFFSELDIPKPHYNLEISNGPNDKMVDRMVEKLIPILKSEMPDALLLYGDTNSTLAGALAGAQLSIPSAHVEAGLRSFNLKMAEERNRIETDRLSSWRFCPSREAVKNLANENIVENSFMVGDVMFDATQYFSKLDRASTSIKSLAGRGKFYLATIHRAENVDDPDRTKSIFDALSQISSINNVILPLHPRTKKAIETYFGKLPQNIQFIEPVGYLDMLHLIRNSSGIFTDSGGLQKEAYFLGKLCATLRDETEWIETVEFKINRLTGANSEEILKAHKWIDENQDFEFPTNIYGDGQTGEAIVRILTQALSPN